MESTPKGKNSLITLNMEQEFTVERLIQMVMRVGLAFGNKNSTCLNHVIHHLTDKHAV